MSDSQIVPQSNAVSVGAGDYQTSATAPATPIGGGYAVDSSNAVSVGAGDYQTSAPTIGGGSGSAIRDFTIFSETGSIDVTYPDGTTVTYSGDVLKVDYTPDGVDIIAESGTQSFSNPISVTVNSLGESNQSVGGGNILATNQIPTNNNQSIFAQPIGGGGGFVPSIPTSSVAINNGSTFVANPTQSTIAVTDPTGSLAQSIGNPANLTGNIGGGGGSGSGYQSIIGNSTNSVAYNSYTIETEEGDITITSSDGSPFTIYFGLLDSLPDSFYSGILDSLPGSLEETVEPYEGYDPLNNWRPQRRLEINPGGPAADPLGDELVINDARGRLFGINNRASDTTYDSLTGVAFVMGEEGAFDDGSIAGDEYVGTLEFDLQEGYRTTANFNNAQLNPILGAVSPEGTLDGALVDTETGAVMALFEDVTVI